MVANVQHQLNSPVMKSYPKDFAFNHQEKYSPSYLFKNLSIACPHTQAVVRTNLKWFGPTSETMVSSMLNVTLGQEELEPALTVIAQAQENGRNIKWKVLVHLQMKRRSRQKFLTMGR